MDKTFFASLLSAVAVVALAQPAAALGAGAGQFVFDSACTDDVVAFALEDNGDGTWTFAILDVGTGLCAWLHGDTLVATGSPAAGFAGSVSSGPWTLGADGSFHVAGITITFDNTNGVPFDETYSITGSAAGRFA